MEEELITLVGGHMDGKQIWVPNGLEIFRCFEPEPDRMFAIDAKAKVIEYVRQTFAKGGGRNVRRWDCLVLRGHEPSNASLKCEGTESI
jgi:hypothetical protein